MSPRRIPAAPAIGEWRLVIDAMRSGREERLPAAVSTDRQDDVAGHAAGMRSSMTDEAIIGLSCKRAPIANPLIERVENRSQLRVCNRQFEQFSPADEAHVNRVIEIDRPGVSRGAVPLLQACLREDERLTAGFDWRKSAAVRNHRRRGAARRSWRPRGSRVEPRVAADCAAHPGNAQREHRGTDSYGLPLIASGY